MPESADQPANPSAPAATAKGDRRLLVWWGVLLGLLTLGGAFCLLFLRPYLQVRAAVGEMSVIFEGPPPPKDIAKGPRARAAVEALGGPKQAAEKCSLYIRCPKRLAAEDEKLLAFYVLAGCGSPAFPQAESLLRSPDGFIRAHAAEALGIIEDPRAVEPLIGALKDPDVWVRLSAVQALGILRDPRAVEPLIVAIKDPFFRVRDTAAWALGQTGDPRAVEPLIIALKDPNHFVSFAAAMALKKIRGGEVLPPDARGRALAAKLLDLGFRGTSKWCYSATTDMATFKRWFPDVELHPIPCLALGERKWSIDVEGNPGVIDAAEGRRPGASHTPGEESPIGDTEEVEVALNLEWPRPGRLFRGMGEDRALAALATIGAAPAKDAAPPQPLRHRFVLPDGTGLVLECVNLTKPGSKPLQPSVTRLTVGEKGKGFADWDGQQKTSPDELPIGPLLKDRGW